MSRRFWYRAGIILLFAVQLTTAVSPITAQQAQPELIPVTLQLKWRHQFQFAGYYAAQQQGYYRAAGLDVTIVEAGLTDDPVEVVVRGDADFGISMSDLILHRARGAPVVALAAIFQHSPIVFLGLERFAIESIHDLAGKQVMVEPNSGELLAYLQAEGVPIGEISQQPHTFTTNLLLDGDIAALSAYLTDEPFVLRQAGIGYRMLSPRSSGIDFYGDTLFTTERQIRERPEVVRAFVDASLRGWNYALDNPEALIDVILTQYSRRHSRDHLRYEAAQSRRLIIPDVVEIGYMNPGRWQYIAETYADLGLMPHDVSLKGFLYQSNTGEDLSWLYLLLAGALLVLGGVTFVAARIYRLNNSIRNEIAERMRIEEHLRALERRYRVLAEHAPFPVVIIHSDSGRIMYTNAEALRTFNISREQARAMLASELYAREDESQTLIAMIAEQGRVHNREVLLQTAHGESFWASISAATITFEEEPAIFLALMDISERKRLELRLESMAMTDVLTGLFNRRFFTQRGEHEIRRSQRYNQPLSLIVFDVDLFKQVNDSYGHAAGDAALQEIAATLRSSLRDSDVAGRIGGEEFGVLLPNTSLAAALQLADRMRLAIAASRIAINNHELRVTASFGVASAGDSLSSLDALLSAADRALYRAKSGGRNRVVSAAAIAAEHSAQVEPS